MHHQWRSRLRKPSCSDPRSSPGVCPGLGVGDAQDCLPLASTRGRTRTPRTCPRYQTDPDTNVFTGVCQASSQQQWCKTHLQSVAMLRKGTCTTDWDHGWESSFLGDREFRGAHMYSLPRWADGARCRKLAQAHGHPGSRSVRRLFWLSVGTLRFFWCSVRRGH